MTAVDHAELKRVAEAVSDDREWAVEQSGLPEYNNVSFYIEAGDDILLNTNGDLPDLAAFIAAANPAVVLALLSEIEGLKADLQRKHEACQIAQDLAMEHGSALLSLRTQAPDSWRPDRELPKVEFHQHDWTPAFAALLPDATTPGPQSTAFCVLNLAAFLGTVHAGDLPREDLPYFLAETMMHELIHVLEQWAGVEFNEERVEALLEKYAALRPQTAESGE